MGPSSSIELELYAIFQAHFLGMKQSKGLEHCVRAMSRVMASELSPRGIRVNVVAPGAARTPIWNGAAPTPDAFAALDQRISRGIPMGSAKPKKLRR